MFNGIISLLSAQGTLLEWLTAVAALCSSFLAVYVIFNEKIFIRGKFKMYDFKINRRGDWSAELGDAPAAYVEAIDIFFYVEQIKGRETKNVNIQIKNIKKVDNNLPGHQNFLLTNLKWDDFNEGDICTSFSKGVVHQCNLGRYLEDTEGNDFLFFNKVDKDRQYLDSYMNAVSCGEYEIEVLLSGENVKSLQKKIRLNIKGGFPERDIEDCSAWIVASFV